MAYPEQPQNPKYRRAALKVRPQYYRTKLQQRRQLRRLVDFVRGLFYALIGLYPAHGPWSIHRRNEVSQWGSGAKCEEDRKRL